MVKFTLLAVVAADLVTAYFCNRAVTVETAGQGSRYSHALHERVVTVSMEASAFASPLHGLFKAQYAQGALDMLLELAGGANRLARVTGLDIDAYRRTLKDQVQFFYQQIHPKAHGGAIKDGAAAEEVYAEP